MRSGRWPGSARQLAHRRLHGLLAHLGEIQLLKDVHRWLSGQRVMWLMPGARKILPSPSPRSAERPSVVFRVMVSSLVQNRSDIGFRTRPRARSATQTYLPRTGASTALRARPVRWRAVALEYRANGGSYVGAEPARILPRGWSSRYDRRMLRALLVPILVALAVPAFAQDDASDRITSFESQVTVAPDAPDRGDGDTASASSAR